MGMRSKPTVQKPMDMYYTPFFVKKKGSASKAIEISQKSPETVHFYLAIPYALPGRPAQPRLFLSLLRALVLVLLEFCNCRLPIQDPTFRDKETNCID